MSQVDMTRRSDLHPRPELLMGEGANRLKRFGALLGQGFLLLITSVSALTILFIFVFIIRDAWPFFASQGFKEFFTSAEYYPSRTPPEFGALSLIVGSLIVTMGATFVAVPLGISAAVCMSDMIPFGLKQWLKPVIEMLAAIPSVAYGFFALVIFAPLLQNNGGAVLSGAMWVIGAPVAAIATIVLSDLLTTAIHGSARNVARWIAILIIGGLIFWGMWILGHKFAALQISSGTNALNVSIILGIMALPTVVSVSEDALSAVGRELREGSYALGATRAETMVKVVLPAAKSGIFAASLLGVMRAIGETMVVWMASGNSAHIPSPWYNLLEPVRTLTATIAGDMGEADQTTGSARYHMLFAMALCLLAFSFICNLVSEWAIRRSKARSR